MKNTNIQNFFKKNNKGNFFIYEKIFNNLIFSDFTLRPTNDHLLEMLNVRFEFCTVSSGTCVIRKGVSLKNVVFSEFDCGDALHMAMQGHAPHC